MSKIIYSKGLGKLNLLYLINNSNQQNVGTKKGVPCYIVDDYAIIKSTIECSDYATQENIIDKVYRLADSGVNVVKIYGYVSDENTKRAVGKASYCQCHFVMDRASGAELYKGVTYGYGHTEPEDVESLLSYMDMLADIPQEHYDKYVADYLAITRAGVAVDPSKKGNFFYDPEKGFIFIDVRNPNHAENEEYIIANIIYPINPYYLVDEAREDADVARRYDILSANILLKMEHALLQNGFTREEIDYAFKEREIPNGSYGGITFGGFHSVDEAREVIDTDDTM